MNRFKIVAIFVGILIFASGSGLIYFAGRSQKQSKKLEVLSQRLEGVEPARQKALREKQDFQEKYTTLLREYEDLKHDRDNVLIQAKRLLQEKGSLTELEEMVPELQQKIQMLEGEKEKAHKQSKELAEEIEGLQKKQLQIEQERDSLKEAYERSQKRETIKELEREVAELKKRNKEIVSDLQKKYDATADAFKKAQKEIDKLAQRKEKAETEAEELEVTIKEMKKNYAEAVKKNKALEKEVKRLPKKFSEIARQNKKLIKDSSTTHYNLGVFYTKNKEYERAIAEFEKSVDINPDNADAHFNLGYIYAEYLVDRKKAIDHFRHFLRLAKSDDEDTDWVRKYLVVWEAYEGNRPLK